MSRVMRKPAFCICENKDADQLRGNREADQRLCFRYTVWFLIAPVPVHFFSITLTQENREACTEIQRRRYDELSWKMCMNSVRREKRRE